MDIVIDREATPEEQKAYFVINGSRLRIKAAMERVEHTYQQFMDESVGVRFKAFPPEDVSRAFRDDIETWEL